MNLENPCLRIRALPRGSAADFHASAESFESVDRVSPGAESLSTDVQTTAATLLLTVIRLQRELDADQGVTPAVRAQLSAALANAATELAAVAQQPDAHDSADAPERPPVT